MGRIAALLTIYTTILSMSCSVSTGTTPEQASTASDASPATVLARVAVPQQFDTKTEAEGVLGYQIPEPDQTYAYARVGKFVVRRSGNGALSSETKYRLADGNIATLVIRQGVPSSALLTEQTMIGGVRGVLDTKWSFRFPLEARTGQLFCLVYALAEVSEGDFARFVESLRLS